MMRFFIALLGLALLGPLGCQSGRSEPARVRVGALSLEVRVEPAVPRVGTNTLWLELRDAGKAPVDGAHIEVRVHMPAMGAMAAMGGPATVQTEGAGRYRADFELAMGGTWQVEVAVHTGGDPGGGVARSEGALTVGTAGLRLAAIGADPTGHPDRIEHADPARPADPPSARGALPEPVRAADGAHPAEIVLDPERLKRIGVGTIAAERRSLPAELRVAGRVVAPEDATSDVALKVRGWAAGVRAAAVGVAVERGETLFELESPELSAAQAELLEALRSQARARASSAPDRADDLVEAARARLRFFGLAEADLARLEARDQPLARVPIRAPRAGFVVEKNLVEGSAFAPGERLYRIASLEDVWIEAEIPESDLARVGVGTPAVIRPTHAMQQSHSARIDALLPVLDPEARTARARLVLRNPELALRPNMYVEVELAGHPTDAIVVPQSAVLDAGRRRFVFVASGRGRFAPRAVEVGRRVGEEVEIRAGLAEGEEVVRSGLFLIAAESRLRAALEQW